MPTRCLYFVIFLRLLTLPAAGQQPTRLFIADSIPTAMVDSLKKEFGQHKKYPVQFEKQILLALSHYPELRNTPIEFRSVVNHTPCFTRVTWGGFFESGFRRHFVIMISDSTEPVLMPLIFRNLPFNAQVGVMGHELAHVADFCQKTHLQIIGHAVKNVSERYLDQFEYGTDAACIAHGLGYQMLDWSAFVRKTMNTENWRGPDYVHRPKKRERYMNPSTIIKRMEEDDQYSGLW